MPSSPTARLRLEKQQTGENLNTWGVRLNDSALDLVDQAIAGAVSKAVSGAASLVSTNYAADEARNAIVRLTGAGGTLTIPAVSKIYLIEQGATGDVTITAGGGDSAVLAPGERTFVYCDGAVVRRLLPLDFGGQRVRNVGAPTDPNDAATRAWTTAQIGAIAQSAWVVRSAGAVLTAGDRVIADTSGGAFTLTLPPAPAAGAMLELLDARATWRTNPLTVARNGQTISGLAEDCVLDQPAVRVAFVFTGSTWAVG